MPAPAQKLRDDGFLVLDRLFPPELIARLHDEMLARTPDMAAEADGRRLYKQVGEGRFMIPVELSGPFLDPTLYANPLLLHLLSGLLGPDLLIDSFTCVTALPGAADQRIHADHPDLFPEAPERRAEAGCHAVNVAVPLIDLDEAVGTTAILPRSHAGEGAGEPHLPYVARGGCFLMDYRVRHGGTANRSDRPRPILYIVYSRPWFTDSVNFRRWPRLSMPRDALAGVSSEHRRLFRRLAAPGAFDATEADLLG